MKNLHILPDAKNIGIKVSGGADSAILYYAIAKHYANNNDVKLHAMTMSTSGKPGYIHGAKRVIARVEELTGRAVDHHHTKWIDDMNVGDDTLYVQGQKDLVLEVHKEVGLDILYQGLTANPKHLDMKTYLYGHAERYGLSTERINHHLDKRDADRDIDNPYRPNDTLRTTSFGIPQNDPFLDGDKRGVNAAYLEYGVLEQLYPYTFSCEGQELGNDDYDNMEHCMDCFFCFERLYGFGRIV